MEELIISQMIKRRNELGLTQQEVAELCNMPQSTIGRIETGAIHPKLSTLLEIIEVLGMKLELKKTRLLKGNLSKINIIKRKQVEECIKIASENSDIKKIIIFGSAVRNDCTKESDVDMCIKLKKDADKLAFHYTKVSLEKACDNNCDILIFDSLKDWFKKKIEAEGVTVYGLS